MELIRNSALTLAALAIIYYCLKDLHIGIFVVITIVATTVLTLADIFYNILTRSCQEGKMTPLEKKDP